MLSRNNWKEQVRQQEPKKQRFTIKKLTIGVASVLIGFTFMGMSASANAQTTPATSTTDTTQAVKQTTPATPATSTTDTTTPIAPSTTVPSYDGTKVVDTPFYNNPQGTNSKLIDNESKDGQYNIYLTAKDASGKEYASSYGVEKNQPEGVVLNSILDKDAGAYNPKSLEFHFYYQNNTDKDQTINYNLTMPDFVGAGHSLVPNGSRISDVKVTSKQGNTYDISSVTKALDSASVMSVPVNLTVKANDAINLVIPFVLNTTGNDLNAFAVWDTNWKRLSYLVVESSTYVPLYPEYPEDKIYPLVNLGNNNYTYDYPDNPGAFSLKPSVYRNNDFWDDLTYGLNGLYNASMPTNKSTVYGSQTFTFLLLDKYEDYLTKHGFTVAFSNGKPVPYYMYKLSKSGAKLVGKNGNPVQGGTKYFEVVPVILLNQDETYTTETAPTAWDPSTMVNKVADPTNYRYWDQKTDSAVRMDNTAAQLTAKDFTVTITKDGQVVKPDANGKYDLSKPGIYTVTYSRDFNGTTISNSGQITVTPVKEPDNPFHNNNNNTNPGNNGNNNGINNGTQNGNGNKTVNTNVTDNGNGNGVNNGTQNGNGNKTVNTNVTDNGNGDNSQNNRQALPQTGNTKNDAAVAGLGLAGLLAMLGLGGLKKKRN